MARRGRPATRERTTVAPGRHAEARGAARRGERAGGPFDWRAGRGEQRDARVAHAGGRLRLRVGHEAAAAQRVDAGAEQSLAAAAGAHERGEQPQQPHRHPLAARGGGGARELGRRGRRGAARRREHAREQRLAQLATRRLEVLRGRHLLVQGGGGAAAAVRVRLRRVGVGLRVADELLGARRGEEERREELPVVGGGGGVLDGRGQQPLHQPDRVRQAAPPVDADVLDEQRRLPPHWHLPRSRARAHE